MSSRPLLRTSLCVPWCILLTWMLRCRQRELIGQLVKEAGGSAAAELLCIGSMQLRQKVKDMLETGGPLLLVLDDLWSDHQLAELLGTGTRLPAGSQLLLTSRRSDILAPYHPMPVDLLSSDSASALLAWHACGQTSLPAHLVEAADDALQTCGGLPLAVKVLGGALCRQPATSKAWKVKWFEMRWVHACDWCTAFIKAES